MTLTLWRHYKFNLVQKLNIVLASSGIKYELNTVAEGNLVINIFWPYFYESGFHLSMGNGSIKD